LTFLKDVLMASQTKSVKKTSRTIPRRTSLFLYVQAGGRCEFDGCNEYLLEHYPTETPGNFAEQAHIWAFSEDGPRGNDVSRPDNINSLANLMLLCKTCHTLIDKNPRMYTVETLKNFKRDHEDRIFSLGGISKDRGTIPLVLRGLVHNRLMDISEEEMQSAVAPNYLRRRKKVEIDLTSIPDNPDASYWKALATAIDHKIQLLYAEEPEPTCALRVSVFSIAPIPLLVYLGSKLSDKMHIDLYQRHRDPESWSWKDGSGEAKYITRCLIQSPQEKSVSLLINLSGINDLDTLPTELKEGGTFYEITLQDQAPSPLFLNTREDLQRFTGEYNQLLARIRNDHPSINVIHLFPAVPAPVAITLGRSRLPKVDPLLRVYDRDKRAGGFIPTLDIL
jgi:SMODS-associated and fused to various effectors sensor domain/HNH endonuclease